MPRDGECLALDFALDDTTLWIAQVLADDPQENKAPPI